MIKVKVQNQTPVSVGMENANPLPVRVGTAAIVGKGGIDVSGASVGQTVKIAAVDENGKPTAWEPADLPSAADSVKAIEMLAECGVITPAYQDGVFYTDDNGAIYVL